jgi:transcription antitermination factor NusG
MLGMDGPTFNVGDKVTIVGGNFDGLGGKIVTAEEAAAMPHRAASVHGEQGDHWVAIDLFGRRIPVQQLPEWLRPA